MNSANPMGRISNVIRPYAVLALVFVAFALGYLTGSKPGLVYTLGADVPRPGELWELQSDDSPWPRTDTSEVVKVTATQDGWVQFDRCLGFKQPDLCPSTWRDTRRTVREFGRLYRKRGA